jgi:hypothetical protein
VSERPSGFFASEPNRTWGTSPSEDPGEERAKAGKVVALAEAGGRVFLGGGFAGVTPPGVSTAAARKDPGPVVRRPTWWPWTCTVERRRIGTPILTVPCSPWPCPPTTSGSMSGERSARSGGKAIRRLAAVDLDTGRWALPSSRRSTALHPASLPHLQLPGIRIVRRWLVVPRAPSLAPVPVPAARARQILRPLKEAMKAGGLSPVLK